MKNCPNCGNSKFFYDQYHQAAFLEAYAMCKFCGYWRKGNDEPKQCNIFYHECKGDKNPLPQGGHPRKGYCWVTEQDTCECEFCYEIMTKKVKWPFEDPNHPFHKL